MQLHKNACFTSDKLINSQLVRPLDYYAPEKQRKSMRHPPPKWQ